jgi:peptidoglycan/LPS O-acetylase OafA/YrhL
MMLAPASTAIRQAPFDGVRGIAILYVTLSHLGNKRMSAFTGAGEYGVWLFFALSAFLLSHYFFLKPERGRSALEWLNYAMRRVLRIYPLYLAALVMGAFVGWWSFATLPDAAMLRDPVFWAVFVEFRFYFLLPFVVVAMQWLGDRHRLLPLVAILAYLPFHAALFPAAALHPGYDAFQMGESLFFEYVPVFLFGLAAAWAAVNLPLRLAGWGWNALLIAMPLASMGLQVTRYYWFPSVPPDFYHRDWVAGGAFFALWIYGVAVSSGYARQLLGRPALRFFGFVSYSTYLFQDYWIEHLSGTDLSDALFMAVALVAIFATSTVLFLTIERPLSRITLKRLTGAGLLT